MATRWLVHVSAIGGILGLAVSVVGVALVRPSPATEMRIRVTVQAQRGEEAGALVAAVLDTLSERAAQIVGQNFVAVEVEGPRVRPEVVSPRVAYAVIGGGMAMILVGLIGIGWAVLPPRRAQLRGRRVSVDRDLSRGVVIEAAEPARAAGAGAKPASDDARYWLQKFLEQHEGKGADRT